jgi:hypothetical protein
MPLKKRGPTANRLLAALPGKNLEHLLANCESIDLIFADVLCVPDDRIRHVYFPTDSFISLVAPLDGYAGLEVGMIGSEGMFGIGLMLGVDVSPLHTSVHEGEARQVNPSLLVRGLSGLANHSGARSERLVTHD